MVGTIIVCGSRHWTDKELVRLVLGDLRPSLVFQGGCRGADKLAEEVCVELGIPCKTVIADWRKGLLAGPLRNKGMLRDAMREGLELVVAFHQDIESSKGTKSMVKIARDAGVKVVVFEGGKL